jgi:hypothetical protein
LQVRAQKPLLRAVHSLAIVTLFAFNHSQLHPDKGGDVDAFDKLREAYNMLISVKVQQHIHTCA